MTEEKKSDEAQEKKKNTKIGCISLLVILFSLFVIIASCSIGGDDEPKPEHDAAGASVMAEQFVKDQLKAPSTAKFQPFLQQQIEDLGDGRYTIRAWVDSQNGFGAMIRTNYICTVKYIGNDKWQCENLEFEE